MKYTRYIPSDWVISISPTRLYSEKRQHCFNSHAIFCINIFLLKDLSIDEMVGTDALAVVRPTRLYQLDFFCSGIQFYSLLSPHLCFISFLYLDLYVLGDDALISLGIFYANQTSMCLDPHLNLG